MWPQATSGARCRPSRSSISSGLAALTPPTSTVSRSRIAGRRAKAQKHFRCQRNARRKRLEPGKLFGSELGMGVFIRRTSALRTMVEDLPLMVSRQAPPALRHDVLRGLKWQQRPRHTVTQVHDLVHTTMPEVTRNRFQGCKVSVNVGDKCDAHVPF